LIGAIIALLLGIVALNRAAYWEQYYFRILITLLGLTIFGDIVGFYRKAVGIGVSLVIGFIGVICAFIFISLFFMGFLIPILMILVGGIVSFSANYENLKAWKGKLADKFQPLKDVKKKEKDWKSIAGRIGPLLTLIGGIFFVIDGLFYIFYFGLIFGDLFSIYGLSYIGYFGFLNLVCGIVAILSIYFGYKGINNARFFCLVPAILTVVGLILPPPFNFEVYILWFFSYWFNLDYLFIFLLILGGVLSLISEERFLNYYIGMRGIKYSKVEEE
jgi:hypothetical protein